LPKKNLIKFEESKEIQIERFSLPNSSKNQKIKDFNEKFKPLKIERRNSEEFKTSNDKMKLTITKNIENDKKMERRSYIPNKVYQNKK
jgi:hypothetical protein